MPVKDQHYVPRFYLSFFANDEGELERFDCEEKEILKPKGPKGICFGEFFYGIETGVSDETSQKIEEYFKKIEDVFGRELKQIILKIENGSSIHFQEKYVVATFMSMMWLRGLFMREQVSEMLDAAIKHFVRFKFSTKPELLDEIDAKVGWRVEDEAIRQKCRAAILNGEINVNVNNALHLSFLAEVENFGKLFCTQDWVVYVSKSKKSFITTDNPVAVLPLKSKGFYGPTFLEQTHYFALTPKICIKTREPLTLPGAKSIHRKQLFEKDDLEVLRANLCLCNGAKKFAYANDKSSFVDILNWLSSARVGKP
jgi:hypothetical protein